ncbi:MAG: aspartyl-tRNA(Asn)/glutamyl-tRNA(Gln) amidotransferase subunit [Candidatus Dependentiae bacterium]|nr:aspartyl-tRNA(Asn)/glutamyl-tRNA(Gln) amidotransferase subunit [Candidatus Dependentiae bacterium]
MAKLQRTDIIKLAELSALQLSDTEVDRLLTDLQNLVSYVDQLNEVALNELQPSVKNQNIFRDDVAIPTSSEPLLAQAPERFQDYFVVPKVIDSTKDAQ